MAIPSVAPQDLHDQPAAVPVGGGDEIHAALKRGLVVEIRGFDPDLPQGLGDLSEGESPAR